MSISSPSPATSALVATASLPDASISTSATDRRTAFRPFRWRNPRAAGPFSILEEKKDKNIEIDESKASQGTPALVSTVTEGNKPEADLETARALTAEKEQVKSVIEEYDQKINELTTLFKKCISDLQNDYSQQMRQLNDVHTKVKANHTHVSGLYANERNELDTKKRDIENER